MDGKSERISFLIYNAYYKSIEHLTDEKLGKLFRAMFEYQNNMESKLEPEIQMAFNFIKNQFELDQKKWEKRVEAQRATVRKVAGQRTLLKMTLRMKNPMNPKKHMGYLKTQPNIQNQY